MIDANAIEERLGEYWDIPDGLLYKIRDGEFDQALGEEYLAYLKSLDFSAEAALPRSIVALLWYAPIFLTWNKDRVVTATPDIRLDFVHFSNAVHAEVERLLGVP